MKNKCWASECREPVLIGVFVTITGVEHCHGWYCDPSGIISPFGVIRRSMFSIRQDLWIIYITISTSIGLLAVKVAMPVQIFPSSRNGRSTTIWWGILWLFTGALGAGFDIYVFCTVTIFNDDSDDGSPFCWAITSMTILERILDNKDPAVKTISIAIRRTAANSVVSNKLGLLTK